MTDYHDLKNSELERVAEEQIKEANIDLQAGERDAIERVQQWANTLASIRQMREHGRDSFLKVSGAAGVRAAFSEPTRVAGMLLQILSTGCSGALAKCR